MFLRFTYIAVRPVRHGPTCGACHNGPGHYWSDNGPTHSTCHSVAIWSDGPTAIVIDNTARSRRHLLSIMRSIAMHRVVVRSAESLCGSERGSATPRLLKRLAPGDAATNLVSEPMLETKIEQSGPRTSKTPQICVPAGPVRILAVQKSVYTRFEHRKMDVWCCLANFRVL